jgi:hypothetical protein
LAYFIKQDATGGSLSKENAVGRSASQVNRALWVYALLVVLVTAASWGIYLHHPAYDNRPLFDHSDQFRDLTSYAEKTAHLHGGAAALGRGSPTYNYPASAAFVYKILLHTFPSHAVRLYLAFLAICICIFSLVALRASQANWSDRLAATAAIATTAALGSPLWFTADRGNVEGVAWAFAAAGLCFLLRAKHRTAAVLIGLAACVKPFSILFLLLLLGRRKYKEAALGLATAVLVVLAALTALGPNPWRAYQDLKPGVTDYVNHYIVNLVSVGEARFLHSMLDGMKSAALTVEVGGVHASKASAEVPRLIAEPGGWHKAHRLAMVYPFIAVLGFGLLLAAFYRMPMLNQLTALGVAVTLFPLSASEYTLLSLYVPFGALLVFLTREVATGKVVFSKASMLAFAVIYALLFSPLTFLRLYAGDAKLLLLLALLFVAARSPMQSEYFSDPADEVARKANTRQTVRQEERIVNAAY